MKDKGIIVVDDNKSNLQHIATILRESGAYVSEYNNGDDAVRAVEDAPHKYQFAVIDDLLHGSLNGIQTTSKLVNLNEGLFCLVFSNIPSDNPADIAVRRAEALDAGAYRYLKREATEPGQQIVDFVGEIDLLKQMAIWLSQFNEARSSVPSLLSQLNVGMHVVDTNYKVWFADDRINYLLKSERDVLAKRKRAPWHFPFKGCIVQQAAEKRQSVEMTCLVQLPSQVEGSLTYIRVWAQPVYDQGRLRESGEKEILLSKDGRALAVIESVHEIIGENEISREEKLKIIADSIYNLPYDNGSSDRPYERVRIYIKSSQNNNYDLHAVAGSEELTVPSPVDLISTHYFTVAAENVAKSGHGYYFEDLNGQDLLRRVPRTRFIYLPIYSDKRGVLALIEVIGDGCSGEVVPKLKKYADELGKIIKSDTEGKQDVVDVSAELAGIDLALQSVRSPKEAVQLIVRTLVELTQTSIVSIRYRDDNFAVIFPLDMACAIYERVALPKCPLSDKSSWSVHVILSGQEFVAEMDDNRHDIYKARLGLSNEAREVLKDMKSMWFLPLIYDSKCIGALGLHSDVSEEYKNKRVKDLVRGFSKRIAQALNDHLIAQRISNISISKLTASNRLVIHNINGPLSIIRASLALLKSDLDMNGVKLPVVDKQVADITHQISRIGRLRKQLERLLFTESKREMCDLHELINTIVRSIIPIDSCVIYKVEPHECPNLVEVELQTVTICLEVLVENAFEKLQAISNGNWVCVRARLPTEKEGGVMGVISGILAIDVMDSGEPVPNSVVDQLFSKPCTTKNDGSGQGLITCKSLIEYVGGKVYHNRNSKMTTFTLLIPYVNKAKEIE